MNNLRQNKICPRCQQNKNINLFGNSKSRPDGHLALCKECEKSRLQLKRLTPEYKKATMALRRRNNDGWLAYFIKKYGQNPYCAICAKILSWKTKDKSNTVVFDHRHGLVKFHYPPSTWYQSHKCSDKNQKTWEEFDYGILCDLCNKRLPTENRTNWITCVQYYIMKSMNNKECIENMYIDPKFRDLQLSLKPEELKMMLDGIDKEKVNNLDQQLIDEYF